jgi:hypothetical protein
MKSGEASSSPPEARKVSRNCDEAVAVLAIRATTIEYLA